MQAVGGLVSFGADQAGLSLVDRSVEVFGSVLCQLREEFAKLRPYVGAVGATAAYDIFVEAALALVDSHGDTAIQRRVGQVVCAA